MRLHLIYIYIYILLLLLFIIIIFLLLDFFFFISKLIYFWNMFSYFIFRCEHSEVTSNQEKKKKRKKTFYLFLKVFIVYLIFRWKGVQISHGSSTSEFSVSNLAPDLLQPVFCCTKFISYFLFIYETTALRTHFSDMQIFELHLYLEFNGI